MKRLLVLVSGLTLLLQSCVNHPPAPSIQGSWQAEGYSLADGSQHQVRGSILFTAADWTVLFFVMSEGEARRGSAEGGRYHLETDNHLVFDHLYHLAVVRMARRVLEAEYEADERAA